MRVSYKQSRTRRLLQGVASLLAVLLTLEVCCQICCSRTVEIVVRDPAVGRRLQTNIDLTLWNAESQRHVQIRTNSYGFRGEEPIVPKTEDIQRVVVLGDSFVNAIQVEECETMCHLLAERLNENEPTSLRWEVLNFGVSGSATADQHLRYLNTIRDLSPDIVITCFSMATDPADNHPTLSSLPMVHYDLNERGELEIVPESTLNACAANLLNQHSQLYAWQKKKINRLLHRFKPEKIAINQKDRIFITPLSDAFEYSWTLTEAILKQFRHDVVEDGVEFHVVTIPSGREVYEDQFEELVSLGLNNDPDMKFDREQPLRRLVEICESNDISILAMEGGFYQEASDQNRNEHDELFYKRKGHLSVAGNRLAAELIADYLHQDRIPPHREELSPRVVPQQVAEQLEQSVIR